MVPNERAIIFIDGSNLYHIIKDMFNNSKSLASFNFEKFIGLILDERKLIRVYYYSAPLDKNKDEEIYKKQQQFFENITKPSSLYHTLKLQELVIPESAQEFHS
ncbi:MAG: hypothetical protein AABX03_03080 [Nanoarchaeota archaeon]